MKNNMKYLVYASGRDCDGANCHREFDFDNEQEAMDFANQQNEGSDGLTWLCLRYIQK